MPYIIDGHNLIGKIPGLRLDDPEDEQRLVEMLQEYCQKVGKQAHVYFDKAAPGQAGANVVGPVTARFVSENDTADNAIARHLKRLGKEAANWTVVSSDNQVRAAAKRARAKILSSPDFAAQLLGSKSKAENVEDDKLNKDEVDEWMKLFKEGNKED